MKIFEVIQKYIDAAKEVIQKKTSVDSIAFVIAKKNLINIDITIDNITITSKTTGTRLYKATVDGRLYISEITDLAAFKNQIKKFITQIVTLQQAFDDHEKLPRKPIDSKADEISNADIAIANNIIKNKMAADFFEFNRIKKIINDPTAKVMKSPAEFKKLQSEFAAAEQEIIRNTFRAQINKLKLTGELSELQSTKNQLKILRRTITDLNTKEQYKDLLDETIELMKQNAVLQHNDQSRYVHDALFVTNPIGTAAASPVADHKSTAAASNISVTGISLQTLYMNSRHLLKQINKKSFVFDKDFAEDLKSFSDDFEKCMLPGEDFSAALEGYKYDIGMILAQPSTFVHNQETLRNILVHCCDWSKDKLQLTDERDDNDVFAAPIGPDIPPTLSPASKNPDTKQAAPRLVAGAQQTAAAKSGSPASKLLTSPSGATSLYGDLRFQSASTLAVGNGNLLDHKTSNHKKPNVISTTIQSGLAMPSIARSPIRTGVMTLQFTPRLGSPYADDFNCRDVTTTPDSTDSPRTNIIAGQGPAVVAAQSPVLQSGTPQAVLPLNDAKHAATAIDTTSSDSSGADVEAGDDFELDDSVFSLPKDNPKIEPADANSSAAVNPLMNKPKSGPADYNGAPAAPLTIKSKPKPPKYPRKSSSVPTGAGTYRMRVPLPQSVKPVAPQIVPVGAPPKSDAFPKRLVQF